MRNSVCVRGLTACVVTIAVLAGIVNAQVRSTSAMRVFELNSGRATFNQYDAGVVLSGISRSQLQSLVKMQPGPNGTALYFDPKLIGGDGRANPALSQFRPLPVNWDNSCICTAPASGTSTLPS